MISNTLTAAQHHEVFTHLLALVAILGAIIIVIGVTLVKMWVRKDSIRSFEARHACLEDDFMQLQARLRNADSSLMSTMRTAERERQEMGTIISNLRAQLRKVTSKGETIADLTFNCRGYSGAKRFRVSANVAKLEVQERDTEIVVVEHFMDGSKLHSKFQRSDIQGGVFVRYAD
ncbi:MAG: hypothetical protein ACRCYP_05615 [Alphaproteobacteria bacterium]